MSSSSLSAPTTLVLLQPDVAVFVIQPNVSDPTRRSTGLKEPTPKRGNADTVALEELDDATERLRRPRRRDDLELGEIAWAGALGAHPLRSTGLDAAEHG